MVSKSEGVGIDGAIMPLEEVVLSDTKFVGGYVCTVDVDNLELFTQKVVESGGKVLTATTEIPGVGKFAYYEDTEENKFGMMQSVD